MGMDPKYPGAGTAGQSHHLLEMVARRLGQSGQIRLLQKMADQMYFLVLMAGRRQALLP